MSEAISIMRYSVKKFCLIFLGAAVGLVGITVAIFWFNSVLIRSIGIFTCLCGAYLIAASKKVGRKQRITVVKAPYSTNIKGWSNRSAWIIGAVSLIAAGGSFAFMYGDALDGYHKVWPVYAFAVSMSALAVVASYIVGILVKKMFSH